MSTNNERASIKLVSNNKGSCKRPLLEVRNLRVYFFTDLGVVRAVDGVSFLVNKKETLGIVGESGCGKSVTVRSIMRLIPYPGRIVDGSIFFEGRNLLRLSEEEMRKIRGDEIAMVFQEPMTSLNPAYRIGNQISETLAVHRPMLTK